MGKIRLGIIGTGQRVYQHGDVVFKNCSDIAILAAVCDNKSDRLAHVKKEYGREFGYEANAYLDYREMLAKEKLDGVYIATPNDMHLDVALAAFEAGAHVLCEKPMEVSLARADQMIAAAKKHKKLLGMAMQMHYRRRYHKVKEIIDSGRIGKVAQVWCTEYRPEYSELKEWVWDPARSGGAIHEKNCHHYDIFNIWLESRPTTVYASGNIMKHAKPHGIASDIVDNAWIINDFENGARGMVGICFLGGKAQGHTREFGVWGTEGKITFDVTDDEIIHVERANGDKEDIKMMKDEFLRGGVFRDFADCIISGKQPLVTPQMGRDSLLVPMAAELSIKEKRIVNISELK